MQRTSESDSNESGEEETKNVPASERGRFFKTQPTVKLTQKPKMKQTKGIEAAVDTSTNLGGRSKRRLAQCVVDGCRINENSRKSDGSEYLLFDAPKDKAGRLRWALYVPEVDCGVHLLRYCKVCELHFVDGKPTKDNPFPSQNLHPIGGDPSVQSPKPAQEAPLSKKRKEMIKSDESLSEKDEEDDEEESDDESDANDFKPAFKIKLPSQKSRNLITSQPLGIKKFKPSSPSSGFEVQTSKVVMKPNVSSPMSVGTLLKDASKPALPNLNVGVSRPQWINPSGTFQAFPKPALCAVRQTVNALPAIISSAQFQQSRSVEDERPPEFEPCQHCGMELVEIRKDLVRVENKIDVVSTLLRSVLQRTLPQATIRPAATSTTSVVKITPTAVAAALSQQNDIKPPTTVSMPTIVAVDAGSTAKVTTNAEAKKTSTAAKPVKLIFNSHGFVTATAASSASKLATVATVGGMKPKLLTKVDSLPKQVTVVRTPNAIATSSVKVVKVGSSKGPLKVAAIAETDSDDTEDEDDDFSAESGEVKNVSDVSSKVVTYTYKSPASSQADVSNGGSRAESHDDGSVNDHSVKDKFHEKRKNEVVETKEAVARAAMLFSGRGVTINHLKEYGPTWLCAVESAEIQNVLDDLVDRGLLEVLGEREVNWPTSGSKTLLTVEIYRKLSPDAMSEGALKLMGITPRQYLASLKQKNSKFNAQLNKICEEDD